MTDQRIKNAIKVIEHAILNGISVKKASSEFGFGNTYVKNVKRELFLEEKENRIENKFLLDDFQNKYQAYLENQKKSTEQEENEIVNGESTNVNVLDNIMTVEWKGVNDNWYDFEDAPKNDSVLDDVKFHGYPKGHIKSLDDLLKKANVDLNEWRVGRYVVNKWDVTAFKSGYPQTWENFQVKATLERDETVSEAKNLAEIFEKLIKNHKPPVITAPILPVNKLKKPIENNLLEINLFDLHIGKLGWAGEVGENYDTKIARARFLDAINNLLKRAEGFEYSRILFPVGNDFFNSDNLFNTTTKGTPQDEDLRWQKTWDMGCELVVDAIEMLKAKNVPIDVVMIPGNHDMERNKYLGTVLNAWFRNDDQVSINNAANPRKYYEFGEVLIGLTHGNEEKENSLPMLMATEQKEAWGRTTFHEWHLGHYHKKRNVKYSVLDKAQVLNEELGVIVRYLSSLSGTEEWHFKKGFVGSQKAGEAFIWNDKTGMIGHLNFNFTDFNREH